MSLAHETRGRMRDALGAGQWFSEELSLPAASFLTGLPVDVLGTPSLSILFQRSGDSDIRVSAGTTRDVVVEAFRGWADAPTPRARNTFLREAYLSMYGLMQAQMSGEAPDVLTEMARLYGKTLAAQDPEWENIVKGLETGISLDGEFRRMSAKMQELWDRMPREMRQSVASYNPRNMFNS